MDLQLTERVAKAAFEARAHAYAPYSNYKVGAAIASEDGEIYTGCNIENVVYEALHAERLALANGVKDGKRTFLVLAVATEKGGFPCGDCRQDLVEFGDMLVVGVDGEGKAVGMARLKELLPDAFVSTR